MGQTVIDHLAASARRICEQIVAPYTPALSKPRRFLWYKKTEEKTDGEDRNWRRIRAECAPETRS